MYSSRMAEDNPYGGTGQVSVIISLVILFKCISISKYIKVALVTLKLV
jgi:hypothetical protein